MPDRQVEIARAKKALNTAKFRLNYLKSTKHFRPITKSECLKRKLCATSAEGGKLRCGRKAVKAYRSRDPKKFKTYGIHLVCSQCPLIHLPADLAWCDMKIGEIIDAR